MVFRRVFFKIKLFNFSPRDLKEKVHLYEGRIVSLLEFLSAILS